MQNLTPKQIVEALDQHIIGQAQAKRAVAVAIRNRWRRRQLTADLAKEIAPKNIIMMGPTGVGKTEIARRLANLTGGPFVKVEATKFTEVGYHGRDVESMIRDLLEGAINMVRDEQAKLVHAKATEAVRQQLLDLLLPPGSGPGSGPGSASGGDATEPIPSGAGDHVPSDASQERMKRTRERLAEQLDAGALDEREVELSVTVRPQTQVMFANMGLDQMDPQMADMFERMLPEQNKRRRVTIAQARVILMEEETEKLLDNDKITQEAITRTQETGIVFLDELDKTAVAGGEGGRGGPDVSRQGVQRDLLPIVEGCAVNTRYGMVQTDHILFIAAGAFHSTAVSDLMPELQGRFPIRVELGGLGVEDFVRILCEPSGALTKQQQALLQVEGLHVEFTDDAVRAMAELAAQANATLENIGARRLMTIMEKVFEQINFEAPETVASGQTQLVVDETYVRHQVATIVDDESLSRFVL